MFWSSKGLLRTEAGLSLSEEGLGVIQSPASGAKDGGRARGFSRVLLTVSLRREQEV